MLALGAQFTLSRNELMAIVIAMPAVVGLVSWIIQFRQALQYRDQKPNYQIYRLFNAGDLDWRDIFLCGFPG